MARTIGMNFVNGKTIQINQAQHIGETSNGEYEILDQDKKIDLEAEHKKAENKKENKNNEN